MNENALSKLLEEVKELNIPRRNCMKVKQELEKAIAETQLKYKGIFSRNDASIYTEFLNQLEKQQVIDKRMHK